MAFNGIEPDPRSVSKILTIEASEAIVGFADSPVLFKPRDLQLPVWC